MDQSVKEMNTEQQLREPPMRGSGQIRSPRMAGLSDRVDRLRAAVKFASGSLSATEIATGVCGKPGGSAPDWENTVLVSGDCHAIAIRHRDQWVNIDEALDSISNRPKGVKLAVSGSDSSLRLVCTLAWEIPPASASFSLLAATTHELESNGGGSLEERLDRLAKEQFRQAGASREITKDLSWGGTPTTLWIKVVDDANPGQSLIDERIGVEN